MTVIHVNLQGKTSKLLNIDCNTCVVTVCADIDRVGVVSKLSQRQRDNTYFVSKASISSVSSVF